MAFKGTQTRTARDIAESIEAVGGEVNAATSVETTAYYVRLLQRDIDLGIEVISDILANSVFEADELAREKHVIQQEIGAAADMPEDQVFDHFQSAAFPDQPVGRSILGTPESIARFTAADLRRFLAQHYTGPGLVLAAAGRLDHEAIVAAAAERFAPFQNRKPPGPPAGRFCGGTMIDEKPLQEAQIILGFEGPSHGTDDVYAGQLLSAILGGGMASRLFQEVREARGLCYSIYSFQWPFTDTGLFGVHAATSEEDIGALMPVVLDELKKIADHVDTAELARAQAQMRAGLLMTLESPAGRAGQMARHIQIHGRPLALSEIVAKIDAVTVDHLTSLAARIITSPPALAAVGPVASLPGPDEISAQLRGSPRRPNGLVHGLSAS